MIRPKAMQQTEVRTNMRGGPGSVALRHLFTPQEFGAPTRLCATLTVPPGSGIGLHEHAGEDELYYVLDGEGMLDEGDGVKVRVCAGDAILTGKGARHSIENNGTQDLNILAVILTYPKQTA